MSGTTRADVEDFLYREAALLDAWELDAWLALWTGDGRYDVPAPDAPDGDPRSSLALIADDMASLRARVDQLRTGAVWAEVPRSRTTRIVANVRLVERADDRVVVASSFVVHRSHRDRTHAFVGSTRHVLRVAAELRIAEKRVQLAHDVLDPHGRISILL